LAYEGKKCTHYELKGVTPEMFWIENLWQKYGIRMINEEQYVDLIYG
jgi:hypothetical protein